MHKAMFSMQNTHPRHHVIENFKGRGSQKAIIFYGKYEAKLKKKLNLTETSCGEGVGKFSGPTHGLKLQLHEQFFACNGDAIFFNCHIASTMKITCVAIWHRCCDSWKNHRKKLREIQ